VADLAPEMLLHSPPAAEQRSHWYAKAAAVFQVPYVVESFFPTAATPERTGLPVAVGNGATT
jgi:hypothetical protein